MTARNSIDSPQHYCIVLLTGLGDVIHGLPVVNAIRDAHPGNRITWVAEPMPASILRGHPSVDRVVVYRRADGISGLRQLWKDLHAVEPIDVTLNFNVYFKSIWPTLFSRAPRRIGFDRDRSYEGVSLAATEKIPPGPRSHTADMFLEFASYLGIETVNPEWRLTFTSSEQEEQRAFFQRFAGKPVATVIPASASYKKDWLPERWARVADALSTPLRISCSACGRSRRT